MDSFFIIADNIKTTHCAGKDEKAPIISSPISVKCNSNCTRGTRLGHHRCAAEKTGKSEHEIRYCECRKNKDEDEHGRRVEHYFSLLSNDINTSCICDWCEKNCKWMKD